MAEKRGKDRAILKLIKAYEYGISSEEEADDFKESKPKVANTTPISPPKPPKINLKDQEVPNPHYDKLINDLDGMPLGDDEVDDDWTGNEVCRFGKYRDVKWCDIQDDSWINWVSTSSKVDWQRELATKELKRRSK